MTQKYFILLKGKDKTKEIKSCSFENENLKVVFKNNPQIYTYKRGNFTLIRKATSYNLFNYLKELCILANIETPEGNLNMLLKEYEKMQRIPKKFASSMPRVKLSNPFLDCSPRLFLFISDKMRFVFTMLR